MDQAEARSLCAEWLNRYRERSYVQLAACVRQRDIDIQQAVGASGTQYQIEIQCLWDDKPDGDVRVVASIDDGGLRAFCPLTDSFAVRPDGKFVGESEN